MASGTEEADQDDIRRALAARGDPRAFAPLYERYAGPVYRFCLVRLRDREAAQDAANETFLKALAGLDRYRGGRFRAWLFQIAHNVVLNAAQRRRPTLPLDAAERRPCGTTLEEAAAAEEDLAALHCALTSLSEAQRAVVELGLAGWTGAEIGAALGKTADAVKMLRYRALAQLRAVLADRARDDGEIPC